MLVSVDHHLGGASSAIVIGTHGKSIGAAGGQCEQVATFDAQLAIFGDKVAGFTDRADHIVVACFTVAARHYGQQVHPGLIQCRAQHIVHGRVDDGEVLVGIEFEELHLRQ